MTPATLAQLSSAVDGQLLDVSKANETCHGVSIDSRQLQPGDAFWAIGGRRVDGHQFVSRVAGQAAVSVINRDRVDQTSGPRIVVDDTINALARFARWHRERHDVLTVGVTGSVGKTTTRELIHHVLSCSFSGIQSPRNFNNQLGVPLTLLQLDQQHEFAVVELGASGVGEIRPLAELAAVEVAVVTAVCPAHLEGFGSIDAICKTKGELVEAVPEHGFAVLNGDDPLVREMTARARCRCILVGEEAGNTLRADNVRVTNESLQFEIRGIDFDVPVVGQHFLTNLLLAIAVGVEVGIPLLAIAEQLQTYTGPEGRCQIVQRSPWTVIDDTYNSNPGSMQAACDVLARWQGSHRRVLISGDMLELGECSSQWHQDVGRAAAEAGVHHLVAVGHHAADVIAGAMHGGMPRYRLAECRQQDVLQLVLDCWLEPGDVVLVKGSRGMQMEQIVTWLAERGQLLELQSTGGSSLPAVA